VETPLRLRHIALAREAWKTATANADAAELRGVRPEALRGVRRLLEATDAELVVLESLHARSPAARLTVRTYARLTRGELLTPSAQAAALGSLRLARLAIAEDPGLDAAERALVTREIDDVAHQIVRRMEDTPSLASALASGATPSHGCHPQPRHRVVPRPRSARETA
jgi:hypothetical protein